MGALYKFDLSDWVKDYPIYVETGTGLGTCLDWAAKYPFQKLYSVELDTEFVDNLRYREEQDERIQLFNDYSIFALPEIINKIPKNQRVLWFLDDHFVGNPDHNKTSYEESIRQYKQSSFPLEDELEIIFSLRDCSKDMFIIDDYFLYGGDNQSEWAKNNPFKYRELAKELNINLTDKFIYDRFKETHNITIDNRDQAYLIAQPK